MTTPATAPARFPEGATIDPARCLICRLDHAAEDAVVFRDFEWSCEVAPGFEVPGWYFLRLRRHALGWGALAHSELTSFGPTVQRFMNALEIAFDAPARYLMSFGEAYPHFHCVITVRTDDIPAESRSGNILGLRASRIDRVAALAHVPAVRAALRPPELPRPELIS